MIIGSFVLLIIVPFLRVLKTVTKKRKSILEHSLNRLVKSSMVLEHNVFFLSVFTDVNEKPYGICDKPFQMDLMASVGSVVGELAGDDPDNENSVKKNPADLSVNIGPKQQLHYSLESGNSSPFEIKDNKLFKYKVRMLTS